MVSVTETAAGKIRELMDRDGRPEDHGLRLKVIGGGCSGFQYQLDFDETTRTDDSVIEAYGIRVLSYEKLAFLTGTELDYDDGLMG